MWVGVAVLMLASCLLWYLSFGGTIRGLWESTRDAFTRLGGLLGGTRRRGFTLYELLFAIVVVSLSALGLFLVFKILWNLAFPG